jgi:hypothetical protein
MKLKKRNLGPVTTITKNCFQRIGSHQHFLSQSNIIVLGRMCWPSCRLWEHAVLYLWQIVPVYIGHNIELSLYKEPTAVQMQAIPAVQTGRDTLVISRPTKNNGETTAPTHLDDLIQNYCTHFGIPFPCLAITSGIIRSNPRRVYSAKSRSQV